MSIECYKTECPEHNENSSNPEGPFCDRTKCALYCQDDPEVDDDMRIKLFVYELSLLSSKYGLKLKGDGYPGVYMICKSTSTREDLFLKLNPSDELGEIIK